MTNQELIHSFFTLILKLPSLFWAFALLVPVGGWMYVKSFESDNRNYVVSAILITLVGISVSAAIFEAATTH